MVNLLRDEETKRLSGHGFVWLSSVEVHNAFLGKNYDGSERKNEYPDPNWKAPKISCYEAVDKATASLKSWADITDQEEIIKNSYIRPMIIETLDPLIELCPYEYTTIQREHLEMVSADQGNTDPIPKYGYITIRQAYCKIPPPFLSTSCLVCKGCPDWVTEWMIEQTFQRYNFSNKKITIKGVSKKYPYVSIQKTEDRKTGEKFNIIYVNFDDKTYDALFALLMTKKLIMPNPQTFQEAVLRFGCKKVNPEKEKERKDKISRYKYKY